MQSQVNKLREEKDRLVVELEGSLKERDSLIFELEESIREKDKLAAELKGSHEEQDRLVFALEGSLGGVWDWNLITGSVIYDENCSRIFGRDQLTPKIETWLDLIHPDEREEINRGLKDLHIQDAFEFEMQLRMPDGSYKRVLNMGKVIERNSESKVVRIVGTFMDLNRRKHTEERLKDILKMAPVFIACTDVMGRYTYVNGNHGEFMGERSERLLGDGWKDIIHPEDRQRILSTWDSAVQHKKKFDENFRIQKPDDTVSYVCMRAVPLAFVDGSYDGFICVFIDMTEQHKSDRLRDIQNRELQKALAVKNDFLAHMSHEIRFVSYTILPI